MSGETLASAMAKAFGEIEGATKSVTGQVGQQRYKYADLTSVIDAIKPALIAHGLFFTQHPRASDNGITVETFLHHAGGESMALGALFVPANKHDAQGFGSALTYARRYALVTAFGVPTEDDDGNAATKSAPAKQEPVSKFAFPAGPATGITQLKTLARELWREIDGCGDDSELNALLDTKEAKALMQQMAALEDPNHREIWEGDGKDNPGLAGFISRKQTEFAQYMADLART